MHRFLWTLILLLCQDHLQYIQAQQAASASYSPPGPLVAQERNQAFDCRSNLSQAQPVDQPSFQWTDIQLDSRITLCQVPHQDGAEAKQTTEDVLAMYILLEACQGGESTLPNMRAALDCCARPKLHPSATSAPHSSSSTTSFVELECMANQLAAKPMGCTAGCEESKSIGLEKGKREKGEREKGRESEGESQATPAMTSPFSSLQEGTHPFGGSAPSYSAPMASSTPWPTAPQDPQPPKRASSPTVDADTLDALRSSYPDVSLAPPRIKAIIEKADRSAVASWQDKMNYQTTKQATAQNTLASVKEARESHRAAWLKHLEESAAMWKDHMGSHQRQQAQFEQLIMKARTEIQEAGDAITQLNRQSNVEDSKLAEESDEKANAIDSPEKLQQEAALRAKVQQTLQECIDLTAEPDTVFLEEEDEDGAPRKRARSKDPKATGQEDVEIGNGS